MRVAPTQDAGGCLRAPTWYGQNDRDEVSAQITLETGDCGGCQAKMRTDFLTFEADENERTAVGRSPLVVGTRGLRTFPI